MAKKQTFESKLKKGPEDKKAIKVVFSYQSKDSGSWRFAEKIVKVPLDSDETKAVEAEVQAGLEYIQNMK